MAGSEALIAIRPLASLDEFRDALRLQQEVWRFADIEAMPLRWFVVAHRTGGQIFGAFDGERMVAFLAAIPGIKPDGKAYIHSHMLGVLPEYRNRGIGRRMKLAQRDEALARGIDLVEWTFDPLELKNAFFNIERLGAIARHYVEDHYGSTASPLHGGLPTDRLIAEWRLNDPPRRGAASTAAVRIAFPADIAGIRAEGPVWAREIQRVNAAKFRDAFARGMAVTRFERAGAEGVYILEPWP